MTIRKLLLSALMVGAFAAPAFAEDAQTPGPGGHAGPGMEKILNADTDGDGFLSKAEFLAVHEKRFAEMDKDGDGKISKDEMKSHRESMREKFKEKRAEWEAKKDELKAKLDEKTESKPAAK